MNAECYREGTRKVAVAAVPETNSHSNECKDDSTTDFDTCEGAPAEFTCQCHRTCVQSAAKQRSSRSVSSSNRARPAKDRRKKRRNAVYKRQRCDGKPIPRRLSLGSTSFEENTPSSSSSCEALPTVPTPRLVLSARSSARHCGDCGGSDHYQTIEQMQLNFEKTLRDLDALNRSFTDECRTESDGKQRKRYCGDSFDSSKRVRLATPTTTTTKMDPDPATDKTVGHDTDQCHRVRRNQTQSNRHQCNLRKKVNLCEEHHRCFRKIHATPS
ncbi:unnamed protein product [Trichogramma brassicae]|uniref:Uncharacterized protein n=1 Tax=Trichogramma brassicae TaxID=86971 RepID=A0A6H5I7K3_9HYME|nr:unnamed protein product [Trichogramma brassicae]